MIPCQRHLFDIPEDVAYLNTAYMSPLLTSVVSAIDSGSRLKANPWKLKISNFFDDIEEARELFSRLMHTVGTNIAIIPSDFVPLPNADEIESVFKVPLSFFMKSENHWSEEKKFLAFPVLVHHFEYQGYDIWGLTAKLIFRLLEVGLGYVPDFPVHHPSSPTWMERALDYAGDRNYDSNQNS